MSTNRRWLPGYAKRAADLLSDAGYRVVPWQRDLLQRLEDNDMRATFNEMTTDMRDLGADILNKEAKPYTSRGGKIDIEIFDEAYDLDDE